MVSHRQKEYRRACMPARSLQLCLTLCDPIDGSLLDSSVHGILQARILEWAAKPSCRESSRPRDHTHISCLLHWQAGSLPPAPSGKPAKSTGLDISWNLFTNTRFQENQTMEEDTTIKLLHKTIKKYSDMLNFYKSREIFIFNTYAYSNITANF